MPAATTKEPMTLEAFHAEMAYKTLTPRQRKMLDEYLTNGYDRTAAILAAYSVSNRRTAQQQAPKYFASRSMLAALAVYFGTDDREQFKAMLIRAVHSHRLTPQDAVVLRLLAQTSGFVGKDSEPEVPTESKIPSTSAPDTRVPVGCRAIRKKGTGRVVAYLAPTGERVDLADVEVVK